MPLFVAHGLAGACVAAALHPRTPGARPLLARARPLLAGALLANAADLDFLFVFALHSRAWHRGFSHSVVFAACVGLVLLVFLGRRRAREAFAYASAYASHALLDYATTKHGGGVELLWPFSGARLALGWWGVSEVPSKLPAAVILKWIVFEFALFAPLLLAVVLWRKRAARASSGGGVINSPD